MFEADLAFLAEARHEAQKAESLGDVPVGAVVVFENQIIGRGHNLREAHKKAWAHAEWMALDAGSDHLKAWRLSEATLYVTLEPCPMCLGLAQQARLKRVVYGAQDPKGGALSLGYSLHTDTRTHHRFSVDYVEDPVCGKMLSDFFRRRREENR